VPAVILNFFHKNNTDESLELIFDDKNFVDVNREKEYIQIWTLGDPNKYSNQLDKIFEEKNNEYKSSFVEYLIAG
jgi:hypothetical protein